MQKKYILFIDSGIGGLSTLSETLKLISADFIYYADNKNAPYGEKSDEFLRQRLNQIVVEVSEKYPLKMLVLACNTATTSSIDYLRKAFPKLTIIGTEPAAKLALDQGYCHPAILATPQTIKHLKLSKNSPFTFIPSKNLATIIEENLLSPNIKNSYKLLREIYSIKRKIRRCDCLVLGCTHYPFAKSVLKKVINLPIIDGNNGVARRICFFYNDFTQKTSVKLILSSKNRQDKEKYKKILNQILANQINLC